MLFGRIITEQHASLFAKRYILPLLLVLAVTARAQYYNSITSQPQSYLTLTAGGGALLMMGNSDVLHTAPGATADFSFRYEVSKRSFFFNFGLGLDYHFTAPGMDAFTDVFQRQDRDGQPIEYRYCYSNYGEKQHTLFASLPIQFGFLLGKHVYIAAGVKASYSFIRQYQTTTDMYTEGLYPQLMEAVSRDVPSYGYYPVAKYGTSGTYQNAPLYLSPSFEAGVMLPLARRVDCRIGAYVEYALPIGGSSPATALIDYSAVNLSPQTQSQEDLMQNLHFNSLSDAVLTLPAKTVGTEDIPAQTVTLADEMKHRLMVGLRVTFRFNVTPPKHDCMCLDYRDYSFE